MLEPCVISALILRTHRVSQREIQWIDLLPIQEKDLRFFIGIRVRTYVPERGFERYSNLLW